MYNLLLSPDIKRLSKVNLTMLGSMDLKTKSFSFVVRLLKVTYYVQAATFFVFCSGQLKLMRNK